jgi:LPXTG-motif cell wall-anchored protein
MMRKWKVLQGFAIATILLQLLSITGSNTALWFIILGLVIIVAVIIGFYRLANKDDSQAPAQPQDPNQNQPQA